MSSPEGQAAVGLSPDPLRSPPGSRFSQALRALACEEPVPAAQAAGGPLVVTPLRHTWDLEEVYRLVHDTYVRRGYASPQPDGRLVHYPHLDGIPETTVLVALQDGVVVGTNSLTLDGPRGLHVDHDFRAECEGIRREGRRLAASWRIATREQLRSETTVVLSLIQETVRLLFRKGVETAVFTFNPRHERIYKRLLNMKTVARREGTVSGLSNAPAVFMRVGMEEIPRRWIDTPELALLQGQQQARLPARSQEAAE